MTKTIELEHHQIDAILITELKEAVELNLKYNQHEEGNKSLVDALLRVLQYYMFFEDYEEYVTTIERD